MHPAFQYLTPIHKADYLRTYLMNFHGGGYSDIKPATGDWNPSFDLLDGDDLFGIGYREVSRIGVATLGVNSKNNKIQLGNPAWWKYRFLQLNYRSLLGNGAYIFKPHTEFTEEWYSQLQTRLDRILPALKENPGRFPKEKPGKIYNGEVSKYPVPWSYILGDIFHPLCYRYRKRLGYTLPPPVLKRAQVLQLVERSKNSEE